jgi:hypothetical protein
MLQHGGFEEDFGIVPSTPTLCVPRRQSGFGEVVSSPHVPQARHFTFATTEPGFPSQLNAPTSTLEDAAPGHMVPATPLPISPDGAFIF